MCYGTVLSVSPQLQQVLLLLLLRKLLLLDLVLVLERQREAVEAMLPVCERVRHCYCGKSRGTAGATGSGGDSHVSSI